MSPAARNKLIGIVHVGKKQLSMDEHTYREFLKQHGGSDSCKTMTDAGLDRVLKAMRAAGLQPSKKQSPKSRDKARSAKTQLDKVRAIWIDMHRLGIVRNGTEDGLRAYVKRIVGFDRVEWLNRDTRAASTVIESLKKWRARES